jgi:hypothetical protein
MASGYPSWDRPAFVGDTPIEKLSATDAANYCAWFAEQVPIRSAILLSRLGVNDVPSPEFLARVETALVPLARSENFWRPGVGRLPVNLGGELTDDGEALGLDVGVLLARELWRMVAGLRWGIRRSRRDDVSYNRPLLLGPSPPSFDPLLVGPNVVRLAITPQDPPRSLAGIFATWIRLLSPSG